MIFNAVGNPVFGIALELLAHRGTAVKITSPTEHRAMFDVVNASGHILEKLLPGFDAATYQPRVISKSVPLAEAQLAY